MIGERPSGFGDGGGVQLIVVRHGRPDVAPDFAGDPPLGDEGRAQAAATAELLAREPVARIWSSGMRRADATAQPLAAALGVPVQIDAHLAEIDRVTGRYANIEAVRAAGRAEWTRFMADPLGYFGIDGPAFQADVLAAFARVLAGGGEAVAVFCHGFPINILLAHALGLDHAARFVPHYGSVTRLAGRSLDRLTLVSLNETAHMPAALRQNFQ